MQFVRTGAAGEPEVGDAEPVQAAAGQPDGGEEPAEGDGAVAGSGREAGVQRAGQ